ncbi:hypothetical protein INT44_007999 [Umbelopsis vinacea]|uniref:Phosphoesterase n=1 Tax=Umbelopsis vinacea TaxID=44442 RepID=A0A8H7UF07_9FUNG|nr:hypothetical protein INT44_007999 [Umbelopsis vinacea]
MVLLKAAAVALLAIVVSAKPHEKPHGHGPSSWKNNIKNVVVLVQENRSFDTLAGGFTYSHDIDGMVGRRFCNPLNVSFPLENITCADKLAPANDIANDDPNHSITGTSFGLYSTYHPDEKLIKKGHLKPNLLGFLTEQQVSNKHPGNATRASEILNYYTAAHIPVFEDMAKNYVLFDKWFCDVPGPTNPNRAYITSGTSHGHGSNDAGFNYGGLPQKSIFQQLSENNITWINYSNSSTNPNGVNKPGQKAKGFNPDAVFYNWTISSGAIDTNVKFLSEFYNDAANGTLPQFTYINPECCSYQSMHPPSPISMGENFIKGLYEALRNGPQWNETLFIVTFDEGGGFADHVAPPVNVPAGDSLTYTELAHDGKNATFDFTRLGVRVPTILLSPWVGKGIIEHEGKNKGRTYSHSSIPAFLAELWDLDNLTPRTAWSSTFEHLFLKKPRTDTPATLPEANSF